jgi:hypothetical protein
MTDQPAAFGELIRYLQNALAIADELGDWKTGQLIEQALNQALCTDAACRRPLGEASGGIGGSAT